MKYPNVINIDQIIQNFYDFDRTQIFIDEKWVECRPIGYQSYWSRLKCTWLVFTGQADVLVWYKQ